MSTVLYRRRLKRLVEADTEPRITDEEIDDLLVQNARLDRFGVKAEPIQPYRPGMKVEVGDTIVPLNDNGHKYTVTVAGTTGASEPTWPTTSAGTVSSNSVTYTEAGETTWERAYDLFGAAADGWDLKASRVVHYFQFMTDGSRFFKEQVFDHIKERAEYYRKRSDDEAPVGGDIIVGGSIGYGVYPAGQTWPAVDEAINVNAFLD